MGQGETSELRDAVEQASARADVVAAVQAVYQRVQEAVDQRRPICIASGRCCRFEEFGHRLYVTTLELAAFVRNVREALGHQAISAIFDAWDGTGCPFQSAKLCGVHAIRPFGCRIFFCDESSISWQAAQYERLHTELKRLHAHLEVPYFYVEWRQALAALSPNNSDAGV